MKNINRRKFIQTGALGLTGLATLTTSSLTSLGFAPSNASVDKIKLGNTGLQVSRIALGTGSIGGNHQSNQTRLGLPTFVKMAHHAYDRGINFFDTADSYGSLPFVKEVFKEVPREKVTLLTKMWTYDDPTKSEAVDKALDGLFRYPPAPLHDKWQMEGREKKVHRLFFKSQTVGHY